MHAHVAENKREVWVGIKNQLWPQWCWARWGAAAQLGALPVPSIFSWTNILQRVPFVLYKVLLATMSMIYLFSFNRLFSTRTKARKTVGSTGPAAGVVETARGVWNSRQHWLLTKSVTLNLEIKEHLGIGVWVVSWILCSFMFNIYIVFQHADLMGAYTPCGGSATEDMAEESCEAHLDDVSALSWSNLF